MAEYHLLRETPANSGTFVEVGERFDGADEAIQRCVDLAAVEGGRFGFWVYEPLRVATHLLPDLVARTPLSAAPEEAPAGVPTEAPAEDGAVEHFVSFSPDSTTSSAG